MLRNAYKIFYTSFRKRHGKLIMFFPTSLFIDKFTQDIFIMRKRIIIWRLTLDLFLVNHMPGIVGRYEESTNMNRKNKLKIEVIRDFYILSKSCRKNCTLF